MEHHESPYREFLEDIVDLHGKVSEAIFARLFVNVCALHGGQDLVVSGEMTQKAMVSLTLNLHNI